jgi:hypothetical protein
MKTMLAGLMTGAAALMGLPLSAQTADAPLYFHPYTPVINSSYQLQPGQGLAIIEPFGGFTRMAQVCVRDARSAGPMPVPTPMLSTMVTRGDQVITGKISVGSCVVLEGDRIALGIADGAVDTDTSAENPARALTYLSGTYSVLGYYGPNQPQRPVIVSAKE